jgi:hypothetical protein
MLVEDPDFYGENTDRHTDNLRENSKVGSEARLGE